MPTKAPKLNEYTMIQYELQSRTMTVYASTQDEARKQVSKAHSSDISDWENVDIKDTVVCWIEEPKVVADLRKTVRDNLQNCLDNGHCFPPDAIDCAKDMIEQGAIASDTCEFLAATVVRQEIMFHMSR